MVSCSSLVKKLLLALAGGRGEGEVFRISSARGWSKDFLCLKFSMPGFLGVGKFGKYFFCVA